GPFPHSLPAGATAARRGTAPGSRRSPALDSPLWLMRDAQSHHARCPTVGPPSMIARGPVADKPYFLADTARVGRRGIRPLMLLLSAAPMPAATARGRW